jgi:hypothetical protein
MTDPDFKARIVRITDAITNPDHLNFNYSGGGGGSGDVNVWNNDSTILLVEDEGGRYFPFSFDPATMHARRFMEHRPICCRENSITSIATSFTALWVATVC